VPGAPAPTSADSAAPTAVAPSDSTSRPSAPTFEPGTDDGTGPAVKFDGLTEDWRLTGTMHVEGRLSDALNRRETISISDVQWAPIDGSAPLAPVPGLKSIDPYDLIAVLAGPDTLPNFTEEQKAAHKVRKEPYRVKLEAPPFRILGTVHVYPGMSAQQLMEQASEMFVPLTDAVAYVEERPVADPDVVVVLVNRLYVRGVEQTG
jgi:hypothetical protein